MPSDTKHTHLKIALLGNPNAGKSSLFNGLTGLKQKTGNYAGVTVDRLEGSTSFLIAETKYTLSVIDLPGIYSLFPKSSDEEIACKTLLDPKEKIDVVVIVADATNLKRNLLLATQLIDLKFKTVLALSMMDEAESQGIKIDLAGLRTTLGVDVIPMNSRKQVGFKELKAAIVTAKISDSFFYDINSPFLNKETSYVQLVSSSLVDGKGTSTFENADKIYRFNTINYLVARYVQSPEQLSRKATTSKIDAITTHRVFGYVVLLAVLFLVFQFIFFISEAPMDWIESAFLTFGDFVRNSLPPGQLNDLLVNGIIAGISGVVMFVPQIAFLFLFIGFLEDSGYMARASFIMDKVMRRFGLNGKSVIPLISGTACAVPSIMATRSISNLKERLITIFVLPLISCSARLPVYTLLIAVLYPDSKFLGVFNSKGLVLFLLYMLGFAVTLITAFFLKRFVKVKEASFFIMELPVYRWPQLKNILFMVYSKVKVFVSEAGKIILAISIVLWFLSSHGFTETYKELDAKIEILESSAATQENKVELKKLGSEKLEHSFIGNLGHVIEPIIKPMGFDWKIGIALITSFAAREVFVGTMATIYQSEDEQNTEGIKQKLLKEKDDQGNLIYTPAVCWSLLLFYAFAMQCMSTMAVVKRETKSWKWVLAQLAFMSILAYASAFGAYQLLS
ncbi:ferrous iron transport protein B [Aurantibacillus circumpalustris]|uniref:ferrous iron transport protein B n=1 Tax=Aurantibacillus circumpalustris TaxID=3036359 RepID=UPI00295AEACB|nr:ferrous iron transport protein B [Aurantibacillus circumpalustris]